VELGVEVAGAVASPEIDGQDREDRRPPGLQGGIEIRTGEHVVDVVVEHVQVVEDRGRLGKAPGELRRGLRHHRHEPPLDGRASEIAVVVRDHPRHQLALPGGIAQELDVVHRGLEPVVGPDLGVELRRPVPERLRFGKAPEGVVVIEPMRRDRLRLLEVVGEQRPVGRVLVPHRVAREDVVQAAVEEMRPVERLGDLPHEAVEGGRHLLLVRRYGGRAEDEVEDLGAGALERVRLLRLQQGLGEMGVAEVDPVELAIELRQLALERPPPGAPGLPAVIAPDPLALERHSARSGMRRDQGCRAVRGVLGVHAQLGMRRRHVRAAMSRERVDVRDHDLPVVLRECRLEGRHGRPRPGERLGPVALADPPVEVGGSHLGEHGAVPERGRGQRGGGGGGPVAGAALPVTDRAVRDVHGAPPLQDPRVRPELLRDVDPLVDRWRHGMSVARRRRGRVRRILVSIVGNALAERRARQRERTHREGDRHGRRSCHGPSSVRDRTDSVAGAPRAHASAESGGED
jgi:hypothetical protein